MLLFFFFFIHLKNLVRCVLYTKICVPHKVMKGGKRDQFMWWVQETALEERIRQLIWERVQLTVMSMRSCQQIDIWMEKEKDSNCININIEEGKIGMALYMMDRIFLALQIELLPLRKCVIVAQPGVYVLQRIN